MQSHHIQPYMLTRCTTKAAMCSVVKSKAEACNIFVPERAHNINKYNKLLFCLQKLTRKLNASILKEGAKRATRIRPRRGRDSSNLNLETLKYNFAPGPCQYGLLLTRSGWHRSTWTRPGPSWRRYRGTRTRRLRERIKAEKIFSSFFILAP